MRKILFATLVFVSFIALILRFGFQPLIEFLGLESRAGLRVESNTKAKVFICKTTEKCFTNDKQDASVYKEAGNTPLQDENFIEGEYLVSLKSEESTSSAKFWQGYVKLNAGTLSVINRELSDNPVISAGEVITLEKGKGVTVISIPFNAAVSIDGKNAGRTPLTVLDLSVGEHTFMIGKEDYLKRSIRVNIVEGFNLTMSVDLALSEADLSKIPTTPISSTVQVKVKKTPTGFLRVRSEPSVNSVEVGRVKPGDILVLLEEQSAWDRVRLPDGKEGYVASSYVEKKNP